MSKTERNIFSRKGQAIALGTAASLALMGNFISPAKLGSEGDMNQYRLVPCLDGHIIDASQFKPGITYGACVVDESGRIIAQDVHASQTPSPTPSK